jgi:hypothetical protein
MIMKSLKRTVILVMSLAFVSRPGFSQLAPPPANLEHIKAGIPVNYDEAKVGNYTLPDVLTLKNGKKVTGQKTWLNQRRPEIVKLFEEFQYGKMPPKPAKLNANVFDKGTPVFDGKAIRKQITVYLTSDTSDHKMDILVYLPAKATKPVPLLLLLSFSPNSSMAGSDPGVKRGVVTGRDGKKTPAPARGMGSMAIEKFTSAGYGIATIYYGDIEPDFPGGYKYGIRGTYLKPGQAQPAADEWGAISAWAWGLSRAMDYLETDKQIDASRVALQGISRIGKTVLWAGAHDTRFKMVIASCGGEGGAAISRRNFGENIKHMTDSTRYFYQFATNWHNYSDDFSASPVDAHMLVSLMAPRNLLLQTGDSDYWSDPKGELLAAVAANPVYKLFGKETAPLPTELPAGGDETYAYHTLGYFMHHGGHGAIASDWDVYLKYMQKYL